MKRPTRKNEAGATLILAMTVLMMLTLVGLMAIQLVAVELDVVGAERNADNALYIAEAGIEWALQELDSYDFTPGNPNYTPLQALPVITGTGPYTAGITNDGWRELHEDRVFIPFGQGGFRAVVKVAPPPNDDTLLIRSLGIAGSAQKGAKRLLEVAVVPGT